MKKKATAKNNTSTKDGASASSAGKSVPAKGGFSLNKEPVADSLEEQESHKFDLGEDRSSDVPASAAGSPAAASTENASTPAYEDLGELPQSYGVDRIFLIARDPQWLFTYWDVDWARHVEGIKDRKVHLKVLAEDGVEADLIEVNPHARNWYLPAPTQGALFTAEIGYFNLSGEWNALCVSDPAAVPTMEMADESNRVADFASLPLHTSFQHLLDTVKGAMSAGESLIETLARLQREGANLAPEWTESRRQLQESIGSMPSSHNALELSQVPSTELTSLSSAIGASWSAQPFSESEERGFFMHVNAEVIFYGGTDPDATVWIDGKEVELEPDGTFRYHFVYPDGRYEVPIVAQSPDGKERRSATLRFQRGIERVGDVGNTVQPPMGGV